MKIELDKEMEEAYRKLGKLINKSPDKAALKANKMIATIINSNKWEKFQGWVANLLKSKS